MPRSRCVDFVKVGWLCTDGRGGRNGRREKRSSGWRPLGPPSYETGHAQENVPDWVHLLLKARTRCPFFAGPKKGTKERACPGLGIPALNLRHWRALLSPTASHLGIQSTFEREIECWGRRTGGAGSQVFRALAGTYRCQENSRMDGNRQVRDRRSRERPPSGPPCLRQGAKNKTRQKAALHFVGADLCVRPR
jgi:hypothetical protein